MNPADGWLKDGSPLQNPGERQVIFAAIDSFHQYRKHAHFNTTHRRRQNLYALPAAQWKLLAAPPFAIQDIFNAVDDAIDTNAELSDAIHQLGAQFFGLPLRPTEGSVPDWRKSAKPSDMSKAHSTLRQFYRDWSSEGFNKEVRPILRIITDDLSTYLREPASGRDGTSLPTILLPGAGLGRLVFELCLAGYSVEGNEISYHQLLASNYVLNCVHEAGQHRIYPFATTFTNNISRSGQLRSFEIPDIHPATKIAERIATGCRIGEMNMTAGDFITSYYQPEHMNSFDAVVTVFFIDTAPNFFRYIQTIHHSLKSGGVWLNFGPLLWHFDDRAPGGREETGSDPSPKSGLKEAGSSKSNFDIGEDDGIGEPGSFELTNEEVLLLVENLGFIIERQEIVDGTDAGRLPTDMTENQHVAPSSGSGHGYIQDPNSMLQNRYTCAHWVARKKVNHMAV